MSARRAIRRTVSLGTGGVPTINDGFLTIAHRGAGADVYPEYGGAYWNYDLANNQRQIEADAYLLSDGKLGIMHDSTVDRTTSGTGSTASFNEATFRALTIDPENFLGVAAGAYGTLNPPMLSDLIASQQGRYVMHIEGKNTGALAAAITLLDAANIRKDQVVLSSFSESEATAALSSGYAVATDFGDATNIAALWTAGFRWLFCSSSVLDATVTAAVAMGFKVIMYTLDRRSDVARARSLGCTGVYSDDPIYVRADTRLALRDTWADGKWMPGMQGHTDRGTMQVGSWGWNTVSGTGGMTLGFLGPITASTFTLRVKFRCTGVTGSTQWFSMAFSDSSMGDAIFADSSGTGQKGYHCLFRTGRLQPYMRNEATLTSLGTADFTAYASDGSTTYIAEMEVNPTQIIMRVKDAVGTLIQSITVTNTQWNRGTGNYLTLRKSGWAGRFSDLELIL